MMMATISDRPPATPEEIWAILRETTEKQKENERQWAESKRQHDEDRAGTKRQRDEDWERLNKMFDKTDRRIDNANEKIGGLDNSLGEIVEHLVAPGIEDRFAELGFSFDRISPNVRMKKDGKLLAEIDLLLENSESVIVVEVKAKPNTRDVEKHRARLEKLRGHYNALNDYRRLYGVMAGAVFGPTERKTALEAGFYVAVQSGDTMKMDLSEDFIPGEW